MIFVFVIDIPPRSGFVGRKPASWLATGALLSPSSLTITPAGSLKRGQSLPRLRTVLARLKTFHNPLEYIVFPAVRRIAAKQGAERQGMPDAIDESPILVEKRDGYRVVALNRPARLNAFTIPMHQVLARDIADAEQDKTCRALLITGTGRAFSTGRTSTSASTATGERGDPRRSAGEILQSSGAEAARAALPRGLRGERHRRRRKLQHRARLRHRARRALGVVPATLCALGIIPDAGGTWLLPRLIGPARARGLALLAEPISAETGGAMGPDLEGGRRRQADERGCKASARISPAGRRIGYAQIKRALDAAQDNDLSTQLDLERKLQREAGSHPDYAEGVKAFLAKRKPVFTGKR